MKRIVLGLALALACSGNATVDPCQGAKDVYTIQGENICTFCAKHDDGYHIVTVHPTFSEDSLGDPVSQKECEVLDNIRTRGGLGCIFTEPEPVAIGPQ